MKDYRVEDRQYHESLTEEKWLDTMFQNGWELISVIKMDRNYYRYFFKGIK